MTPLDQVADMVRTAFAARHGTRKPLAWAEVAPFTRNEYRDTVRAALHGIGCLPDETLANVWKRLPSDPCKHGVRPDQATRAFLEALAAEVLR